MKIKATQFCLILTRQLLPVLLYFVLRTPAATAQEFSLKGQISSWLTLSGNDDEFGLRYLPDLIAEKPLGREWQLSGELSLNLFGVATLHDPVNFINDATVRNYRSWLRLSNSQAELRVGLQKLSFGPAVVLRPLRWFDRIDPRDPLQITEGVYGALARYYFLNNANIWLWGLYGKGDAKGWEFLGTADQTIEFGGRLQHPLGSGEMAFTFHHRTADFAKNPVSAGFLQGTAPENRFAFDGKWDVTLGVWFESAVTRLDTDFPSVNYSGFHMVGADYTFALGTGLHVLAEHMLVTLGDQVFAPDTSNHFTALEADYSHGLLDRFVLVVQLDWENQDLYRYLSWGRRYDHWSFYLNGFWNPRRLQLVDLPAGSRSSVGAGKGLQVQVVFNH